MDAGVRGGGAGRAAGRSPGAARGATGKALLDQEGRDDMHLRIAVQPGGCA
ncbi:iron-sulfur cluster insertion protein ErpA, partial [Actinosynnema sp. NPDC004786]